MKTISFVASIAFLFCVIASAQAQTNTPENLTLVLKLDSMPGIENSKSFWEVSYDWRIADKKVVDEKTANGFEEVFGEAVIKGSAERHDLSQVENRRIEILVPIKDALQDRIKNQEANPQIFLLNAKIRAFDAKTNKTTVFSYSPAWFLKLFPDGYAEITFNIKADGGYSKSGPNPKTLPKGFTVVGAPTQQTIITPKPEIAPKPQKQNPKKN
jgi:hypothetical protein